LNADRQMTMSDDRSQSYVYFNVVNDLRRILSSLFLLYFIYYYIIITNNIIIIIITNILCDVGLSEVL